MTDTTEINTQILSAKEIRQYLQENTKGKGDGFAVVTNSLKVWKQTTNEDGIVIVALEIPVGAEIYSQLLDKKEIYPSHKIRASVAEVIKQFSVEYVMIKDVFRANGKYSVENYLEVKKSQAYHNENFTYRTGQRVYPLNGFSRNFDFCASGIHFFVNLSSALEY